MLIVSSAAFFGLCALYAFAVNSRDAASPSVKERA